VVVGDGGMFARMVASTRSAPVVPMLDGGRQLVYVLGIGRLCAILRDVIRANGEGLRGRAWNLQQPQPHTLRAVIEAICRGYGFRRLLLPVPARPILVLLLALEKLPLPKLPITSTNVKGLIQGAARAMPSDFDRFGYPAETLDELVAKVAPSPRDP
jgi:hypothetical protein